MTITSIKLELEIKPLESLELTETSQWIYVIDLSPNSFRNGWERIRVWKNGSMEKWSTDSSDIKYESYGKPPYTHYMTLPVIRTSIT
jgi:hypothetical protein